MNPFRGWFGEMKTNIFLWFSLPNKTYHRYHNLILPSKNGTTQIDHLIISVYGLFIVETKNKKGWIFGSEDQDNWTQSIFGKSYTFQNPLKQTIRQKLVLSAFLNLSQSKIHTVVYFVGGSTFKTIMPENVINYDLGRYIKRHHNLILSVIEVNQIIKDIEKHLSESSLSTKDHIKSLKIRHGSNTICPNCGSNLVVRKVNQGQNPGTNFLGCEKYPSCRFTKDTH